MIQTPCDVQPGGAQWYRLLSLLTSLLILVLFVSGCSVKRLAANAVGDALTGDSDVFASDEDPDLIREALPFGLKPL